MTYSTERGSQASLRLTCLTFCCGAECQPSSCDLLDASLVQKLCQDVLAFMHIDRLRHCRKGYAGIDRLSLPINCSNDKVNWHQLHEVLRWINPRIINLHRCPFNSPSSWPKLPQLVGEGCQVLRLGPDVPELYKCVGQRAYTVERDVDLLDPDDGIYPY